MSERLSDEDWLDGALSVLNTQFKGKNEPDWSVEDAINIRWSVDSEDLSELVWALDPEKDIDLSEIPGRYFRVFELFGDSFCINLLWIPVLILISFAGLQFGLFSWPWWALGLVCLGVLLLYSSISYFRWNTEEARIRLQAKCDPLTLHILLSYRKSVQSENPPPL